MRELENAIERAFALSSGAYIHTGDFPSQLQDFRLHGKSRDHEQAKEDAASDRNVADRIVSIANMEKNAILETVQLLKGDKLTAAKLLGIGKTTLYRKLKEYGISEGVDALRSRPLHGDVGTRGASA